MHASIMSRLQILLLLLPLAVTSVPVGSFLRGADKVRATPTSRGETNGLGFTALRSFPAPTDVGSDLMLQAVDVTGSNETFLAGTILLFTFIMDVPLNASGGVVLLPMTNVGYGEALSCQDPARRLASNATCLSSLLEVYASDPIFFFASAVEYLPPLASKRLHYVAQLPQDTEGLHLLAANVCPDGQIVLRDTKITFLEPGASDQLPLLETEEPTVLHPALIAPAPPAPAPPAAVGGPNNNTSMARKGAPTP